MLLLAACGNQSKTDLALEDTAANDDISTMPELGTATNSDSLLGVNAGNAAGSRGSRVLFTGDTSDVLNGAAGWTNITEIANVSSTELGYLDGVTSPIQDQINAITVGSPVTTAPTYKNDTCTKGQYAYSANGLTKYDCVATNTWFASSLTDSLSDAPMPPTATGWAIDSTGLVLSATFSEIVQEGSGGPATMTLACTSTGNHAITADSLTTTATTWAIGNGAVESTATDTECNLFVTNPANGIESVATGDDMESIGAPGAAVTNGAVATCDDKTGYSATLNGVASACDGWTVAGTVNCASTDKYFGTYAVSLTADGGSESVEIDFSAFVDGGIFLLFKVADATPAAATIFLELRDSADGQVAYLQLKTDGNLKLYSAGGTGETATYGVLADNTWYVVWLNANNEGDAELYVATAASACTGGTCTRPAVSADVIDGTNTNQISNARFLSLNGMSYVVDKTRIKNAEITNVSYCDAD